MRKKFAIMMAMAGLMLCMAARGYVQPGDKPVSWKRLEFVLPKGWSYLSNMTLFFVATKDGQMLQQILMGSSDSKQKQTSPSEVAEDTPSQEAAEILMKGTKVNGGLGYNLIDSKPAKIGGVDGYRLLFDFKSSGAHPVKYKVACYWFFFDKTFYVIRFIALAQRYFDRDLPDFEQFIGSFKIKPKK